MFHAQLGARVKHGDALRVASSMFVDGMSRFGDGRLDEALELFEQALAINQKYLTAASSGCVLCYNNIAAVHDRLGNLVLARDYYERSLSQLTSGAVPRDERGYLSRRRRGELLKQVTRKLQSMPRSLEPKVGEGVPLSQVADLRAFHTSPNLTYPNLS